MAAAFDLTSTARSLLNMEVNTIVCDAMTGEPMPPAPHALLDIARDYADALCIIGVDLQTYFGVEAPTYATRRPPRVVPPPAALLGAGIVASLETFDRLRWAADWTGQAADAADAKLELGDRVLLVRIVNNCDAIKEMIRRFDSTLLAFLGKTRAQLLATPIKPGDYKIAPDDLIVLQKMWDIGVAEIIAQTIVHVTGDVTTRVVRATPPPGLDALFSIHRQSVDVSVQRWKALLDAVTSIAGAAIGRMLRP
jgi:hypothetical protein